MRVWLILSSLAMAGCARSTVTGSDLMAVIGYNFHVAATDECLTSAGWATEVGVDPLGVGFIEILVDEAEVGARSDEVDVVWDGCARDHEDEMPDLLERILSRR